jgi:hypothetical protein
MDGMWKIHTYWDDDEYRGDEPEPDEGWEIWTVARGGGPGWETDCGMDGYGLSKAEARFLADAANEKEARDGKPGPDRRRQEIEEFEALALAGELGAVRRLAAMVLDCVHMLRDRENYDNNPEIWDLEVRAHAGDLSAVKRLAAMVCDNG